MDKRIIEVWVEQVATLERAAEATAMLLGLLPDVQRITRGDYCIELTNNAAAFLESLLRMLKEQMEVMGYE